MSSCSGSGYLLNRISSFLAPQSRELLGFGSLASRYSVRFLAPFRSSLGLALPAELGAVIGGSSSFDGSLPGEGSSCLVPEGSLRVVRRVNRVVVASCRLFCRGVVGVIHQFPPSMFSKFFVPRLGHMVGWHDPVIVRGILESLLSSADASCICCGMVHRV